MLLSHSLSVVPGSHRSPIHEAMGPQEYNRGTDPQPFGVDQPGIHRVALASNPGDVIVFCHTLFHAVFNARGGEHMARLALSSNDSYVSHRCPY
jgi:ectoine hydroxylase-related dioxygenase (phytanoyl-CoA dioxygenase family)